eukprot:1160034-Pelagomonas_calceolata.AAC.3
MVLDLLFALASITCNFDNSWLALGQKASTMCSNQERRSAGHSTRGEGAARWSRRTLNCHIGELGYTGQVLKGKWGCAASPDMTSDTQSDAYCAMQGEVDETCIHELSACNFPAEHVALGHNCREYARSRNVSPAEVPLSKLTTVLPK